MSTASLVASSHIRCLSREETMSLQTQVAEKLNNHVCETLRIERATDEDMNLVAGFIRSSAHWYAEFIDDKDVGEHSVDEDWAARNFAIREFFIGIAGSDPVGTVSLQYFGEYAYVGYIYLEVDQVGRGYGQQLLKFAESQARKHDMKGMALICHPKAKWASRAYEKFGFRVHAKRKEEILAWNDRVLEPHFEQGFELYLYDLPEQTK